MSQGLLNYAIVTVSLDNYLESDKIATIKYLKSQGTNKLTPLEFAIQANNY